MSSGKVRKRIKGLGYAVGGKVSHRKGRRYSLYVRRSTLLNMFACPTCGDQSRRYSLAVPPWVPGRGGGRQMGMGEKGVSMGDAI